MKTFKTIIYIVITVLLIAVIAGSLIVRDIKNGAKPVYQGEIEMPALEKPVEIIRDQRGVPHIYAENENDLYLAVGYTIAQERLWQMDLIRRATTGRLSEIFGEDYIQTDLFLRSLRMTGKSKMVLNNTDPEILNAIDHFVQGVNYYIKEAGKKLPPEFRILGYEPEPWTAENTANIIGYMGWDLAGGSLAGDVFMYKLIDKIGKEAATKLLPYHKYTGDPVYPDFKMDAAMEAVGSLADAAGKLNDLGISAFHGSNNWAVSGELSETGKPILSNDMHLGLSSPGIWMQIHQVVPGKLNVTGVVVPGAPFIIAGHNEKIAWGMTNLMVDDVDLYLEQTNENKTKYMVDGQWQDIMTVRETIKVKKEDSVEKELKYTHRGPIISSFRDIEDADITMRWSGNDMSNEIAAVYKLNRADNWTDFKEALSGFNSISQNFVYADIEGNIGLQTGGGIPMRDGHGAFVHPGDSSRYDWKGYVPHEELPYSYNPGNHFVSSANNPTVFPENYPHYVGTYFSMPYRINRIREMLTEKDSYSIEDFKRMITDRRSDYAKKLGRLLLGVLHNTNDLNELEKEVYDNLSVWDFNMSPDMFVPTFFEFFRDTFASELLKDDMGDLYPGFSSKVRDYYLLMIINGEHSLYVDNIETEEEEKLDDILLSAYHKTIERMREQYTVDTDNWAWGDLHRFTARHPLGRISVLDRLFKLNVGSYRVGGSNHTVSPYSYGANFEIDHGASERHIFNTADWDESYTVIPTGTSGVPASEFYCSQTETYCNDGFYKDHFSREAVEEAGKYVLVLEPGREES